MSVIFDTLNAFRILSNYQYKFSIACSKKQHDVVLTFQDSDFYHLAGFQYLKDIDIPKSPKQLFRKIDADKINDELLSNSTFYTKVNESYANVKDRILGLKNLQDYIESNNTVFKYIKHMNQYSAIQADFLIKSTVKHQEAYIFLRKRSNQDTYCICSFFVNPSSEYNGLRSYWLYKGRIDTVTNTEHVWINKL